ncbi:MAG: SAM-dependent chlorinase/fluorinase [Deltaproteobacteria bacterium]|nr:SAM-dependent chlorinase/fluorinase [Deltaproteobacteria bacterium]
MKTSGIITLTTDFGLRDPYVAVMKGVILSINPDAKIVDVSHQVPPGALLHAASVIKDTITYFPHGTINVVVVDPGVGGQRRPVAIETEHYFFIGPDNGIFWPIIEEDNSPAVIHLDEKKYFLSPISDTFHGRDIFAPVAAYVSLGIDIRGMGPVIRDPGTLSFPRLKIRGNVLCGEIIRVDNFGNLITNIHRTDMEAFLQSTTPSISIEELTIKDVKHIYTDVPKGEPLALYGSSNRLEIAVREGSASDYLGLTAGEAVGMKIAVSKHN